MSSFSAVAGQGDADKKDLKSARALFKKGTSQFNAGSYEAASASFREAYALQPNWKLQFNIAQSEAAAKRHGTALTAFETYLALGGDDIESNRRDEVQNEIERLKRMVGYVSIEAPNGATIMVDGIEQGTAPLAGVLPVAGSVVHEVSVRLENGETLPGRKVSLVSGQQTKISFVEKSDEPVVAVAPVPEEAVVAPEPVDTTAAETVPAPKEKRRKLTAFQMAGWVTLGVGAATLIAGGVTGGLALSTQKDIDKKCPDGCYDNDMTLVYKRDNLSLTSDVLFAVGGTVTAAGIVLVVINLIKGKKERNVEKTVYIHPFLNNQNVGASLGLRF